MIRHLSINNNDLYVLEEGPKLNWEIKKYHNIVRELKHRIREYFGMEIRFNHSRHGLEAYILRDVIKMGANITTIGRNDASHFFDNFINNMLLKTCSNDNIENYLRNNSGNLANYHTDISQELNEKITSIIINDPSIIEININDKYEFFKEVILLNGFSPAFSGYPQFLNYINEGVDTNNDPTAKSLDLVLKDNKKKYLIEIKTTDTTNKRGYSRMKEQLLFGKKFFNYNFNVDLVPIGVYFTATPETEYVQYKQFHFIKKTLHRAPHPLGRKLYFKLYPHK